VSDPFEPDPELLRRAMAPDLRIGRGILAAGLDAPGRAVLLTQPGPGEAMPAAVRARFDATAMVESLEASSLEALDDGLPELDRVVGFGGGMTMDAAKFVAWRRGVPLILAPSIASVDASVTNTIAVRRDDRVVYEGFVVAERIVADLDVISGAPPRLNRAGVGDLLSIHTALVDWPVAAMRGVLQYDVAVAARSAAVLERLYGLADEVAAVSDVALEAILRGYAEVNALCLAVGHSGPEEGSEHFFAYRVEAVAARSFVHGELVGLGTVLMARLQDNAPERVVAFLDGCGVAWRPDALGLDRATLVEALAGLPAFVRTARLAPSIIDVATLDGGVIDRLIEDLPTA
jgi:glycerol-1-phosphate dehydrogenase [NAD(P)+]